MREQQQSIIRALRVQPEIEPASELAVRIAFMQDYLRATHAAGFVLGISGGQDSTLVGRLAQLAVEGVREEGLDARFVAVRLPHGVQQDEDDAQLALSFIQPDEVVTVNIQGAVAGLKAALEAGIPGLELSDFNRGNVKARMRMVAQYAIAGERKMLVLGTDQAAEAVTGFYTKYGDGGTDLNPIAGLTKEQGREILRELNAPERLWQKAPTADLLDTKPGRLDEDELGLRYQDIDAYLTGYDVPEDVARKIESIYSRSSHKRHMPVLPTDTWWRVQAADE